jgi:hypothetical protein
VDKKSSNYHEKAFNGSHCLNDDNQYFCPVLAVRLVKDL